jgi:hypothetical protein
LARASSAARPTYRTCPPYAATGFARTRTGRVLLVLGGAFFLSICVAALFSDFNPRTNSPIASQIGTILTYLEGAAACGYLLFRGRRTPS